MIVRVAKQNKKKDKIIITLIILILLMIVVTTTKKESIISNAVRELMKSDTTAEIVETSTQGLVLHADELIKESTDETNMAYNTKYLQELVDKVSNAGGGVVHIPSGTFYFTSGGINARGTENYVIKSRDNVLVEGEGTDDTTGTILKPYGTPKNGLDMFYYNQYRDTQGEDTTYIVNADFRNFVIDGGMAVGETYNTSGKGFMLNLYRDCDWENVVVKNTDGTGFGMDNPINCTVKNCIAINCGKNANTNNVGASGFGIGTGFSEEESIYISNCTAIGNKKYGFFFEHQGRFQTLYRATKSESLVVSNCKSVGNLYNFGGARANDVTYENCTSLEEDANSVNRAAFYFEEISRRVHLTNCKVEKTFTDLTDNTKYYYEPAYWALNNGISTGTTVTNFGADELCTRTYALEFLYRMAGRPGKVIFGDWKSEANAENFKTNFSDLATDASCIEAIKWAEDEGLLDFLGTEFLPSSACTKDVFITILWKYAGSPIVESENNFPDVEDGAYYENAVNWAVSKGIVKGNADGNLEPTEECTRGQIITYLYRFYNSCDTYSITYNLNQGEIVEENPASYTVGGNAITLNAPIKVGYTFDGWTGSNGTTPEKQITINKDDTGNKIYTANWTANNYTVVFNSNGGNGEMEKETFKYDCPQILSPNEFKNEGYDFKGWNTKQDGTGITYTDKQAVNNLTETSNKEITLYAQWEIQNPNNRKNIFIGDSIYVEMNNIVGGDETWVASRGQGLDWVKNTALTSIENQIGDRTNVIIGICLNDLFNKYLNNGNVDVDGVVEMYAEYFNAKAIEYTQLGANVYFMGPGPVDDSKIDSTTRKVNNADIVDFNNKIQTKLEGITFINLYENIINDFNAKNPDLSRADGTHGTALYYSKVYNIIKQALGQDYVPTFEAFYNMTDISANAKYIVPLKWGYENVFIDPISETKFGPNNTISRADAITLIWRSQGIPYYNCELAFTDVSKNDSYYDAVMWGVGNNIVAGLTDSTFGPNNSCQRGHYIMFLWRIEGKPVVTTSNNFTDVENGKTYTDAINWAVSEGIINEDLNGEFRPEEACTRAEAITFAYNYYNRYQIYKVEHYKQNIDGTYPEEAEETEIFKANIGTSITPETKIYEGFTAPDKQTEEIAEDGSTVVKYYYTRNSYMVTVTKGEGIQNVTGTGSYKYEEEVKIYAILEEGYENITWTGDYTTNIFNMPSKDVKLQVNAQKIKCIITSPKYNISQSYISDISDKTTVQKLKNSIETNATEIKILNKNNEELSPEDIIGTGMTLLLKLGNKTESFKLVINGDVDGDGYTNIKDILSINKHRLNKATLENEYLLAGDVTDDGVVDAKDILKINKYRLKKIDTL